MPFGVERITGISLDFKDAVGVQDPKHKTDVFQRLVLPDAIKASVFYTKNERMDVMSDTQHSAKHPWVEQYTAIRDGYEPGFRGINSIGETGEQAQGVSESLGLIMTFHGTYADVIAIDENNKEFLTEDQAVAREEAFATTLPRARRFQFRLHEVIKTDGPQARERLNEAVQQQTARAQEQMFSKQEEFFSHLIKMIQGQGGTPVANAAEIFKAEIAAQVGLTPEQIAAQEEYAKTDNLPPETESTLNPPQPIIRPRVSNPVIEQEARKGGYKLKPVRPI